MKADFLKSQTLRIWLAAGWLAFTTAMVIWWWTMGLAELGNSLRDTNHAKYRMLMWEGVFFLFAILLGGGILIFLLVKDFNRQKQVKMFFSTFSHDLKTSMARLRLQADVLREDNQFAKNSTLERLAEDINRLDLQLENSLILSQGTQQLFIEKALPLSKLLETLRREWEKLEIVLEQEALLQGDRRALLSLFRNLLQNAVVHGGATQVVIGLRAISSDKLQITLQSNGRPFTGDVSRLGLHPWPTQEGSSNGIGLYLCRSLLRRQGGDLSFENSESRGLVAQIRVPGSIRSGIA